MMQKKEGRNEQENAVSPVIGVILMVAITVILAAVIAAFVFGMAGGIQNTKIVGVTVAQQPGTTNILVTYIGGSDSDSLETLSTRVTYNATATTGVTNQGAKGTVMPVGSSFSIPATAGQDHVVVVAGFNDGTEQMIFDGFR